MAKQHTDQGENVLESSLPSRSDGDGLARQPWYRSISREQWKALVAALLGYQLDAMDFVLYLMALTTLQQEFHYDASSSGLLATVALLTSSVGGVVFGWVGDRWGRTRALMATILIYSLCSLGTATAQSWTQLLIWRGLLGIGLGGEWAAGAVLVSETWPAAHRNKAIGMMQSGWALGYMLAAVVAAGVLPLWGWRWLFVAGALPALLVVWVRRQVHEPEIWRIRAQDGGPVGGGMGALFGRALLGRTLLSVALFGTPMFGYWGLFTWLPAFLASPLDQGGAGLSLVNSTAWIVTMQLGAFAGYLSFGFLADRFGRNKAWVAFLLAAAVLVPVYAGMAHRPTALLFLGPLLGYFGHGYFSVFGALLAELFPTGVRASAQGLAYGAARAASALAPYLIGSLAESRGIGPALALTSAFFVAGAVLIVLVPATGSKLADDPC
jgi:MFS family permease